ncbi:MAG: hypothetical protein M1838_002231 [Thelocarpon superellum]|nr:MAG: hypothetical protein M1838_002231 [Thelocarpon superellum]
MHSSPLLLLSPPPARRRDKYSARPFYLTLVAITILAACSFLGHSRPHGVTDQRAPTPQWLVSDPYAAPLVRRDEGVRQTKIQGKDLTLTWRRPQCKRVYLAADQCAFIRANCADEEAGLLSYLELYYCRLPQVPALAFIIIVLWLGLLFATIGIAASDFFCVNLSSIASSFGMSESMAGVTLLALGNGSPDVFSTFAAMNTHSGSLAVGELIGAAGFITAVVAGAMAVTRPFGVARKSFVRDVTFFIVAASFTMAFLVDGHLYLWECVAMVAFYVFYVMVVVVWHWWLGRRRHRLRGREAARRGLSRASTGRVAPGFGLHGVDDVETPFADEHASLLPHRSSGGLGTIDASGPSAGTDMEQEDEDDEEEEEDEEEAQARWLAHVSHVMRVSRRPGGDRRSTGNPIRPSLVGALEFRAGLSSRQNSHLSRRLPTRPAFHRRHSEDPSLARVPAHDLSYTPDPDAASVADTDPGRSHEGSQLGVDMDSSMTSYRARAVSANDATSAHLDPELYQSSTALLEPFSRSPTEDHISRRGSGSSRTTSPRLSLSPVPSLHSRRSSLVPDISRTSSPERLAPPPHSHSVVHGAGRPWEPATDRTRLAPKARVSIVSPRMTPQHLPRIVLPTSPSPEDKRSAAFPFPAFTESPAPWSGSASPERLPSPALGPDTWYHPSEAKDDDDGGPSWWPDWLLPRPRVLMSTLFPTLDAWDEKNVWERFLGLVAAPSVFLLTITLPVVEVGVDEDEDDAPIDGRPVLVASRPPLPLESPMPAPVRTDSDLVPPCSPRTKRRATADNARSLANTAGLPESPRSSVSREWNRWLVFVQAFTAPCLIVAVAWANTTTDVSDGRALLLPALYALLVSCILLVLLVLTTTPERLPRWRILLCFVGFVVSVAWISTIANEVVGVLKAVGVILGISDAILGLTVFAVGNSLGDLVADITVARLGFPVMALSACFGGPMLNILLGVGISGMYLMIRDGTHRHDRHPHKRLRYRPYQIDVSSTLLVSGATLLVTLVGLLIVVPWNGWRMDRKVGWGLIVLWTLSTVGNLVIEALGFWGDLS